MSIDDLSDVSLIDHHAHGLVLDELSPERFAALITDAHLPPPAGVSAFQKPLGLSIRRFCAPLLDLAPGVEAQSYVERRAALGAREVARRFLKAANLSHIFMDTGHPAGMVEGIDVMRPTLPTPIHEVIRLEFLAEEVLKSGVSASQYARAFADKLAERAREAIALKSIVAYRSTFKIPQDAPSAAEVVSAADDWLREVGKSGKIRLTNPTLVRFGLWTGAEICRSRGLPLHLHSGMGDADVYMHACDPTHFTDFIRAMESWSVPIVLLHNYPFIREAGWLSEVFQNVYFDVSAIVHYAGPSHERIVSMALEYAPYTKLLHASDAIFVAEAYYLGAAMFRRGLKKTLDRWIADDFLSVRDADEIVGLVSEGNARRIYKI